MLARGDAVTGLVAIDKVTGVAEVVVVPPGLHERVRTQYVKAVRPTATPSFYRFQLPTLASRNRAFAGDLVVASVDFVETTVRTEPPFRGSALGAVFRSAL